MRNKYRILAIALIGIILLVICLLSILFTNNRKELKLKDNMNVSNEIKVKYDQDWISSICEFLKGNIEYKNFPISNSFRSKYNSVTEIISGKVMGTIEANSDIFDINEDYEKQIMCVGVKTGNGFEEIIYQLHYIINENNELDDIEILDSRIFENADGSYPHYDKYHYYYDDPKVATDILCFPYRNDFDGDPYRVYVTNSFTDKFPDCQDDTYLNDGIVGDTNYLICGEVTQDKDQPNICYVEFLDIDYTKTYKVTFEILDDGYINDATIELYKKEVTKDPQYVKELYEGYKENVRWF